MSLIRWHNWTRAALTLLATLPLAAAAAPPTRTSPPVKPGPTPPRQTLHPLDKARFKRPTGEEMAQIYGELRKKPGWNEVQVALVPTGYVQTGSSIFEVGAQFATFFGDVDGDRRGNWVVGCYLPPRQATSANPLAQDDRARIVVFSQDKAGIWRAGWTSPGLGYEFAAPAYNVEEVHNGLDDLRNLLLPLSMVDVDVDGRLEIAYHCRSGSAGVGGLPGVYRRDGGRWVSIAPQADRFSLQDLDGDRKLEVITGSRRIGHGQGDDDVPRVWRWRDKQYREASSEFPRFYSDLAVRYQDFLKRKERSGEEFDRSPWERAIQKANLLSGRPAAGRGHTSRHAPI